MRVGPRPRLFAVAATVLAAAALLASSPAEYSLSADPVSGRVTVSPENPEVRIPFTATANDAARTLGHVNIRVGLRTVWTATPQNTIDHGVEVFVDTPHGEVRGSAAGGIDCAVECLGANELVIRWPLEEHNGKADVEWTIASTIETGENEPPDDASLTVEATPSGGRPEPVATHVGGLPIHGLLVSRISVDAAAPIAGLALHHVGLLSSSTMLSVVQDESWLDLPAQHGLSLDLPSECASGPCVFEILTAAKTGHVNFNAPFGYEVMAVPGEEASITATAETIEPWSISRSSPTLTVNLHDDAEPIVLPFSSSLAVEVGSSPIGAKVTIDVSDLDADNGVRFDFVDRDLNMTDFMGEFRSEDTIRPLTKWVPIACAQATCTIASDPAIEVSHGNLDEMAPAEAHFTITVEYVLPEPIAGAGAATLEVGWPK